MQKYAASSNPLFDSDQRLLLPINQPPGFSLHRYALDGALGHIVDHVWILRWSVQERTTFDVSVLPLPCVNLVLADEGAWFSGVQSVRSKHSLIGRGTLIGVRFRPGGFYPFYARSVANLTDRRFEARELLPSLDNQWRTQLLALDEHADIVSQVTMLLGTRPLLNMTTVNFIDEIIRIAQTRPDLSPMDIARQIPMAHRTLQQLFKAQVGVSLKSIMVHARILKALEMAAQTPTISWTSLSHDMGFSDQAHFTNQFRRIVGRPPVEFLQTTRQRRE